MTPKTVQQPLPQIPSPTGSIPPPPVFGAPQGQKPTAKSATPTFLGTSAVTGQANKGEKQLVGQ